MLASRFLLPIVVWVVSSLSLWAQVTPETALKSYVTRPDASYGWELRDSFQLDDVTAYHLLLTSQQWREHTWRHQMTVFVPRDNRHNGALLFVTGGSNTNEQPNWSTKDNLWPALAGIASQNKAITVLLKQVPNQPFYGDLKEDALISYTLHQFKKEGDYTWPLLFPMVKSAVRAMDAVQEFSQKKLGHSLSRFVVSGASKRGWTSWLSAALDDPRVAAIAPMVIDILNMPVNLDYQLKTYGEYSVQIEDYVKIGIPQSAATEQGKAINTMIDPYSYRAKFTVPKMIFIGTNDEYWTIDNIKHYFGDLPGQNLIHYVPNAGHDLGGGEQALRALSAFLGTTLQAKPYPVPTWQTAVSKKGVAYNVKAYPDELVGAKLWSANSPDRDFRNDRWSSQPLPIKKGKIQLNDPFPASGFRAVYIDLTYRAPHGGEYTLSTRTFVTGTQEAYID